MSDLFHVVGEAHRAALVLLCKAGQQPFSGLQAGARALRKRDILSNRMVKRLTNFETAFAVMRHITEQHVDSFLAELLDELANAGDEEQKRARPQEQRGQQHQQPQEHQDQIFTVSKGINGSLVKTKN